MRNFPKYVSTMQDLLNAVEFDRERSKALLASLIATKDTWLMHHKLEQDESVVETDTIKIVVTDNERYVYMYAEDPNCALFKLGFKTAEEAEEFLASL